MGRTRAGSHSLVAWVGEYRPAGLHFKSYSLTPALSPKGGEGEREPIFVVFKNSVRLRKRELICAVCKPEFDVMLQVGVARKNNSVSPLSLRERARVRGF
ncbi:hypothetical protein PspS49_23400 [Pseudomonas sp. S49]|nr:hypothetical protein PspS49_23400 [Pseudomonas sp. S49]